MSITEHADHHVGPTSDPTEVSARPGRRDTQVAFVRMPSTRATGGGNLHLH